MTLLETDRSIATISFLYLLTVTCTSILIRLLYNFIKRYTHLDIMILVLTNYERIAERHFVFHIVCTQYIVEKYLQDFNSIYSFSYVHIMHAYILPSSTYNVLSCTWNVNRPRPSDVIWKFWKERIRNKKKRKNVGVLRVCAIKII